MLLFDPGAETHNSSANIILAAIIAERATGKKILGLYHEVIIDPLELKHTFFIPYETYTPMLISGFVHHIASSMSE